MQNQNCRTSEENTESIFDLRVGESLLQIITTGEHILQNTQTKTDCTEDQYKMHYSEVMIKPIYLRANSETSSLGSKANENLEAEYSNFHRAANSLC